MTNEVAADVRRRTAGRLVSVGFPPPYVGGYGGYGGYGPTGDALI